VTADDVALIWLRDQSKTEIVAKTLRDNKTTARDLRKSSRAKA
jgi:hypothetical protein